jgi:hypothetical protein
VAKAFRGVLDEDESLSDGCFDPVTVEQVAAVCPWIKTALETGGADYCEPEWSNTTLLATFMVNGEEVAHRLGNKHSGYIKTDGASTKKKWREKLTARENGIGPTSCEKIFACRKGGVEACRSCPLFHKKSGPIQLSREVPLHLALPTSPAADPQGMHNGSDGQWPNWPDPLDFHQVPIDEAIARVNAAGYFVLTLSGDIYKIEPGGGHHTKARGLHQPIFLPEGTLR